MVSRKEQKIVSNSAYEDLENTKQEHFFFAPEIGKLRRQIFRLVAWGGGEEVHSSSFLASYSTKKKELGGFNPKTKNDEKCGQIIERWGKGKKVR